MTTEKMLEHLRKEAARLEKSIDKYLSYEMNGLAEIASKELCQVKEKIKELEGK